jgi:hypothetical protein
MESDTFDEEKFAMRKAEAAAERREKWRYTFAGMAMQGLIAGDQDYVPPDAESTGMAEDWAANVAVLYADALLKELEKPRGQR